MDEMKKESKDPQVETEIRGTVGIMNEIMIDQIGDKAIAVNVVINQGLKQKERWNKITHVNCYNS